MGALMATRWGRRLVWLVGTLLAVGLALGVGRIVPDQPQVAIGVVGVVLALGLTVADPAAIPLMAMPLLLVVKRVGTSEVDLSLSDAALGIATVTALVFAPRPFSRPLRTLLWLSALYQFATLFTVVANPFLAGVIEWFHAWMLVAGALLVGWTIGRTGHARAGLSLFLVTALALAAVTLAQGTLQYAQGNFGPVFVSWPYGMHKNFVGTVMGFAAAVAYARPVWMGWRKGWALTAFTVLIAALAMSQSRQALVGLAVALVLVALRSDAHRRRSKLIIVLVIPALLVVATTVRDQIATGNIHNSIFQRVSWFQDTLGYWSASPWFGHGLRYWYRPGEPGFQPPNAELELLATAGIVGLIAFLILVLGTLGTLWRIDPAYGTLAVAVLLSRLAQSQLDLFWISVQTPLPFVIAGICLGALALAKDRGTPPDGGVANDREVVPDGGDREAALDREAVLDREAMAVNGAAGDGRWMPVGWRLR
ncbi:O-antigen ligase family protein [Raineyella sp. LH-20]|uniref:O-antigen ligase family protein n=1 Tax=Raineyella sp. LH-20 TaxID=3081204 RepID=UPI002955BFFC|nr:O-antigen ligase family protein [Raineyella sp. LH-20]WOP17203.1 O-antigen ligase family protein [Raineyella sp. LH-20]